MKYFLIGGLMAFGLVFGGFFAGKASAAPVPPPACSSMTFDHVVVMPSGPGVHAFVGGSGRYLIFGSPTGTNLIRLQTMGTSCIVGGAGMNIITAGFGPGDVCYTNNPTLAIGCETVLP